MSTVDIAQLIGTVFAVVTAMLALWQARAAAAQARSAQEQVHLGTKQLLLSQSIAQQQFLLQFYEMIQRHNDVHSRLIGDGWDGSPHPTSPDQWTALMRYVGLLSTVLRLLKAGIFEESHVDEDYSHRFVALFANDAVRQWFFVDHVEENLDIVELMRILARGRIFRHLWAQTGKPAPETWLPEISAEAVC